MKRISILITSILVLLISANTIFAQNYSAEEKEVYNAVVKLFDGMRAGDSSIVSSVFDPDCRMYSNFNNKEGENVTVKGSLQNFLTAVGTPHDEIWDEKIWDVKIEVDLGVAQAWCDYAFYRGTEFSHCGIDAFQFIRKDGQWKIIQLIDTRKKDNCEQ